MEIEQLNAPMISVSEARALISREAERASELERLPLEKACGRILGQDLSASISLPPFRQTSVDGFGICGVGCESWKIIGESRAGESYSGETLRSGEALRLFTGAEVPTEVETMLMQEHATGSGDILTSTHAPKAGDHLREVGSHVASGAKVFSESHLLTPASIGLLASLGLDGVSVRRRPKIGLILSGDELLAPGAKLSRGKVYESNSFALRAALESCEILGDIVHVPDDEAILTEAVAKAECDFLLVCGGMSVGDYDLAPQAIINAGGKKIFHKIAQRPGKPLFFGTLGKRLIFGIPGNPASTLVCFYEYILPALRTFEGHTKPALVSETRVLRSSIRKPVQLDCFLKGSADKRQVEVLDGQASFVLSSLSAANVLVCAVSGREEYSAGEEIEVHLLPHYRSDAVTFE